MVGSMDFNETHARKRLRAYLASPLFSDAERMFNETLSRQLEDLVEVYLPQRDGGLMRDMVNNGINPSIASGQIFQCDIGAICRSDYVIAVLDGGTIDEGVAFELGVAFSHTKRCIGLQTDSRRLSTWGTNPMIKNALEMSFLSVDGIIQWLSNDMQETLEHDLAQRYATYTSSIRR